MLDPKRSAGLHGRTLLYVLAFPAALALDIATPLGIADWLIEVILVWIASVWGSKKETRVVLLMGFATLLTGLWSSSRSLALPLWLEAINRLMAVLVMLAMTHVADRRRAAEEAERKAAGEIKRLQGLLPICASCKAIRDTVGEWHKLETYLATNSEARLSHGLCPGCTAKYMDELNETNYV
jgi:hypothetical protein